MDIRKNEFLGSPFDKHVDEIFEDLLAKIKELNPHNRIFGEDEIGYDIYHHYKSKLYSFFFTDFTNQLARAGVTPVPQAGKNSLDEWDTEFYFSREELYSQEEMVRKIMTDMFDRYLELIRIVVEPFSRQYGVDGSDLFFLDSMISSHNHKALQKIDERTVFVLKHSLRTSKPKLRELDKTEFLVLSEYIKREIKDKEGKVKQADYFRKMEDYISDSRANIIRLVEIWFDPLKFKEWFDGENQVPL